MEADIGFQLADTRLLHRKVERVQQPGHQLLLGTSVRWVEREERVNDYAVALQRAFGTSEKLSFRQLVRGVSHNDGPVDVEADTTRYQVVPCPDPLPEGLDRRVAYSPSVPYMLAGALIYAEHGLLELNFIERRYIKFVARTQGHLKPRDFDRIRATHWADDHQHLHAMAPATERITTGAFAQRIVDQLVEWYERALREQDLFYIGKMQHTIGTAF
jgi:hypothetical protein